MAKKSNWWDKLTDFGGDIFESGLDFFTSPSGLAYLGGMGLSMSSMGDTKIPQTGYQGGIPDYSMVRDRVPMEYDPNRRPGSMGQRYFSDAIFAQSPENIEPMTIEQARAKAAQQIAGLGALNTRNQTATRRPAYQTEMSNEFVPASSVIDEVPVDTGEDEDAIQTTGNPTGGVAGGMRKGGIAYLSRGQYLNGMTDGMADRIPASIDNTQPAALSDGEFVIPADVVSHLGNGNSNAGAKELDQMMSRLRKQRTGNPKQGKQIKPNNFLPV